MGEGGYVDTPLGGVPITTPDPQIDQQEMGEGSSTPALQTDQQEIGESSRFTKLKYSEKFYTSLKPGQLFRKTTPQAENLTIIKESGEKNESVRADTVKEMVPVMLDQSFEPIVKPKRSFSDSFLHTSRKVANALFNSDPITEKNVNQVNQRFNNIFNLLLRMEKVVEPSNIVDKKKNESNCLKDYLLDVGKNTKGKIVLTLTCKGEVVKESAPEFERIDTFESEIESKLHRIQGMHDLQGSVWMIPANHDGKIPVSSGHPNYSLGVGRTLSDMLNDPINPEWTWWRISKSIPPSFQQTLHKFS